MKILTSEKDRFTSDFNDMLKIVILNSFGFFYIGFLVPIIARVYMGASGLEISLLVAFQVLGRTISGAITGIITDKVKSRSKLILIGSLGRAVSYFLIYFAIFFNSIVFLGIGTFALGYMAGVFWVPFNTLIAEKSNKENRSQAYGKRNSYNAIGQVIGTLIGFGLSGIFLVTNNSLLIYISIPIYGIANIFAGIIFDRKVDESIIFEEIDPKKENRDSIEDSKKLKNLNWGLLIGVGFLMFVLLLSSINASIAKPFLNIYIIENIEPNIILAMLAYLPAGVIATLFAPKLGEIVDSIHPFIGIMVTSTLGALTTWFLINTYNLWIFSLFLLFDMAISISAGLIFQNLLSRISRIYRGKALGIGDFFMFLGNFIGPILGGITWDLFGQKFPFIISIFVELSLIPFYALVIYLLLPNLAEKFEAEKEIEP
ncbi:MAG: MFS transporter [Promethearchaeota archaeon]|nr:MAG: MFS transporter [Candidatus Lokiarchaeota archaeon]